MSIDGINGTSNIWQWPQAAARSGPGSAAQTQASGNATANAANPAAGGGITSFMQALSDDLNAMLTQLGSAGSAGTGSAPEQTAANRAVAGAHHHHHHHQSSAGSDPSLQSAANQVSGK